MREEPIELFSGGVRVSGILRRPESDDPSPAIVQGPGWLGLKDSKLYVPYHQALTSAGYRVLIFDYRGFGESDGDESGVSPRLQIEDLTNAVSYLQSREDVIADRIGVFGSGGTGGGNAVMLAGLDPRVRCAVSQVPVADGEDWLRRMRRGYEWTEFLKRLESDRQRRVLTGKGEWVHPREDIMVPTPERRATRIKKDVDDRIPSSVPLAVAEEIIAYKPIDVAPRVRNLLVIAVAGDDVTPTDHAVDLYRAAEEPKKMIMQHHTSPYASYSQYGPVVIPEIVAWFDAHLGGRDVEMITPSGSEVLEVGR